MTVRSTVRAGVAVVEDAQIWLLTIAWVVLVVALVNGWWYVAAGAALLAAYHVALVVPRVVANRVPGWVAAAPRAHLVVANVFIDNKTPDALARELIARDGDVVVIAEWNSAFASAFDAAGGRERYAHRVLDPADTSDYAVAVLSRHELGPSSEMIERGPLKVAQATITVGSEQLMIIALNPMAAVDPGGFDEWERQLDELRAHAASAPRPFVIAGDLNTTTYRTKTRKLLKLGLVDAHESLGKGLSPSFKLAADGALAAPGAVVRLDHALLSDGVRAVATEDLDSAGSDHLPFRLEVAVRPMSGRGGHGRRRRSTSTASGPT